VPELPEVETLVRELRPQLVRRSLTTVRLHHRDVVRGVSATHLLRVLEGNRVRAVQRRAKHVVITLTSGDRLVIQLRMTGSLLVHGRALDAERRRHVVLEAAIGRGRWFVFRDVRRLGTLQLLDEQAWAAYTARIGPEPLDAGFDLNAFVQCMSGTRQAVKKALMDQRRLGGVGNIYANEALFRARIDPSRPADRIDRRAWRRLFREVRAVLREGISAGGTTVRDYRTSTGATGSYQHVLRVYGRPGEPCVRCRTALVTTHAIDGRATTFCWRCQGVDVR